VPRVAGVYNAEHIYGHRAGQCFSGKPATLIFICFAPDLQHCLLNLRAGPRLQAAAEAGASAVATAGSPAKRSLLRRQGCTAVYSSRDTHLTDGVAIHGGVGVVVNSLTSPGAL